MLSRKMGNGQKSFAALNQCVRILPDGILLSVKLQPRASSNAIAEAIAGELRVKVTAPPVDSAANEALLRLLSDTFDLPRNRIELVKGRTSRHKVIKLYGLSAEALTGGLAQLSGAPKERRP